MLPQIATQSLGMMINLSKFLLFLSFLVINALISVDATPAEAITLKTRFTSATNSNVSLRFVTNSGVCETTPGVQQISGYVDVGTNMSMVSIFCPK